MSMRLLAGKLANGQLSGSKSLPNKWIAYVGCLFVDPKIHKQLGKCSNLHCCRANYKYLAG